MPEKMLLPFIPIPIGKLPFLCDRQQKKWKRMSFEFFLLPLIEQKLRKPGPNSGGAF